MKNVNPSEKTKVVENSNRIFESHNTKSCIVDLGASSDEEVSDDEISEQTTRTEGSSLYDTVTEYLFPKKRSTDPSQMDQIVIINDRVANRRIRKSPSNYIRTTKYNILTFIPKNLFEQFRRVSNLYFLGIMIITLIPGISPIFPLTSIMPVVIILGVTALKDIVEDLVIIIGINF